MVEIPCHTGVFSRLITLQDIKADKPLVHRFQWRISSCHYFIMEASSKIEAVRQYMKLPFILKDKQIDCLKAFMEHNDIFVSFLTEFGRSIISTKSISVLPWQGYVIKRKAAVYLCSSVSCMLSWKLKLCHNPKLVSLPVTFICKRHFTGRDWAWWISR